MTRVVAVFSPRDAFVCGVRYLCRRAKQGGTDANAKDVKLFGFVYVVAGVGDPATESVVEAQNERVAIESDS